jgi:hypothetical protein
MFMKKKDIKLLNLTMKSYWAKQMFILIGIRLLILLNFF